jgi:hypothetical protein
MFAYNVNETHDGHKYCVNLYSTSSLSGKWNQGVCESKHLAYDAHTVVSWNGRVWTA